MVYGFFQATSSKLISLLLVIAREKKTEQKEKNIIRDRSKAFLYWLVDIWFSWLTDTHAFYVKSCVLEKNAVSISKVNTTEQKSSVKQVFFKMESQDQYRVSRPIYSTRAFDHANERQIRETKSFKERLRNSCRLVCEKFSINHKTTIM